MNHYLHVCLREGGEDARGLLLSRHFRTSVLANIQRINLIGSLKSNNSNSSMRMLLWRGDVFVGQAELSVRTSESRSPRQHHGRIRMVDVSRLLQGDPISEVCKILVRANGQ